MLSDGSVCKLLRVSGVRVLERFRFHTGIPAAYCYLATIVCIAIAMVATPFASAQDSTPASEAPPVVEIEPDPQPELPPVDPAPELPPDQPEVTPEPEPAPTEAPVIPDPTTEPEPVPTQESTPEPTSEPTAAPTQEPVPVITWSQTNPAKCELRDGPAGLKYGQSRTYYCEAVANVSSDLAMPDDMEIEWKLGIDFPDSHQLKFAPGSKAEVKQMLPGDVATSTKYTIAHPWKQGSEQKLKFELVITRTSCVVGEQILTVQANPEISTESDATITRQSGNIDPKPAKLKSPVVAPDGPSVAFEGPISFNSVDATSAGLRQNVSQGTATIVVSGEWDPCTTWSIDLSGTVSVPAETPAQLRAVTINNEPISGEACELQTACEILVLPATGTAASPLTFTIGLELQLHELTPVGDFGITVSSEVRGEGTNP